MKIYIAPKLRIKPNTAPELTSPGECVFSASLAEEIAPAIMKLAVSGMSNSFPGSLKFSANKKPAIPHEPAACALILYFVLIKATIKITTAIQAKITIRTSLMRSL